MATANISQLSTGILKSNAFNEPFLYNINRDSFTKISAHAIFDTELKHKLFKEDSLYIIIGTDSGLLPKYVEYQGIPSGTRYLFVELEDVLNQLQQHQLLDTNSNEIIYSTFDSWEKDAQELKLKEYCYIRGVSSLDAICTQQANIPEYTELKWQVTETLQAIHFKYSSSMGSELFTVRQIQNIADNILPAKLLHNIYQGCTAIVLAGGPSLTSQLPWVKENRSKLIIFAVSRISRQLAEINIEPDFIFSVDPQSTNIDVSKEMFQFENAIFIHSYHADTSLISQWHGLKLYLGTRYPWKSSADPENINSTGPTVSNTAVTAAHYFGCQQILLAGFDLCYTKEGITHAEGSDEAISGPKYDSSLLQVETYNGEKRTTEPEFHSALFVLGRQASTIIAENKTIINLSINAAKAENIKYLPHTEITLDTNYTQALEIASQHIPHLTASELDTHYQSIITELKKTIHHITLIKKLSRKALQINEAMYNEKGEIENYKDKKSLDNIEKKLNKQHRNYSALVKNFGVRNFIKITSPHDDSDLWTAEKAKKIGKIYYESYLSGSQQLLAMLNDTLLRTKIRTEELKSNPDFSQLIKQWTFDKSYNRANLWIKNNADTAIPKDIDSKLKALNNDFQKIIKTTQTKFKATSERQSSLPLLKTKAVLLFKHRKLEELKNLEQGIERITDQKKEPYLCLISAYSAELENNPDLALQYYESIINFDDSPLLEEALLRITSINIEKGEHANAYLALKCLSQISPVYLPYYADSARIMGETLTAIDSYIDYINFFPDDVVSQLKLVNLYIELKVYDAAELMINHILAITPDHQTAITLQSHINKLKVLH